MCWIIILGGVALIGFALYGIRCSIKEGLSDGVFIFIAGIIFAGLLALLGMFLAKINGVNKEYNYNLEENIKIIALQDTSAIHGRKFILSGYIDEEMYYNYMADLGNNSYKMDRIKADDTTIRYSDNPHIETYVSDGFKNEKDYAWCLPIDYRYSVIYIPEGSIINEYEIDLE